MAKTWAGNPNEGTTYRSRRRRRRGYPTHRPPTGYYDPALDASVRASDRGLEDLVADTETANVRAENDYTLGRNDIFQARDQTLEDILRNQTRTGEDYGRATTDLGRQYGILGDQQRQSGNAAGVLGGGFQAQAAQKRAENQGIAQSALDLSRNRAFEDYDTGRTRTTSAADEALGELGLGYQRGTEDRATALTRAQRENNLYGQDINEARWFGARAAGYVPPPGRRRRPRNKQVRPGRMTYG